MQRSLKSRLDALEQASLRRRSSWSQFTVALMQVYATSDEVEDWLGAGQPEVDRRAADAAIEACYAEEF
jgi:hypothetical protein